MNQEKLTQWIYEHEKEFEPFNVSETWKKTIYMIDVHKKLDKNILKEIIKTIKDQDNDDRNWSSMCLSLLYQKKFLSKKWMISFYKTLKNIELTPNRQETINNILENGLNQKRMIFYKSNGETPRGILNTLRDRPLMEFDLMQVSFKNKPFFYPSNREKFDQIYRYDIGLRTDLINGVFLND